MAGNIPVVAYQLPLPSLTWLLSWSVIRVRSVLTPLKQAWIHPALSSGVVPAILTLHMCCMDLTPPQEQVQGIHELVLHDSCTFLKRIRQCRCRHVELVKWMPKCSATMNQFTKCRWNEWAFRMLPLGTQPPATAESLLYQRTLECTSLCTDDDDDGLRGAIYARPDTVQILNCSLRMGTNNATQTNAWCVFPNRPSWEFGRQR